jgi:nucleoside diphosphate kinase
MKELYKQGKVIKNIIHSSGNKEEAEKEIELILGIKQKMEVLA